MFSLFFFMDAVPKPCNVFIFQIWKEKPFTFKREYNATRQILVSQFLWW